MRYLIAVLLLISHTIPTHATTLYRGQWLHAPQWFRNQTSPSCWVQIRFLEHDHIIYSSNLFPYVQTAWRWPTPNSDTFLTKTLRRHRPGTPEAALLTITNRHLTRLIHTQYDATGELILTDTTGAPLLGDCRIDP